MNFKYLFLDASHPAALEKAVLAETAQGFDLAAPLVYSFKDRLLMQTMYTAGCLYEYRLAEGSNLAEFKKSVNMHAATGFELMWTAVEAPFYICQWMQRMKENSLQTDEAAAAYVPVPKANSETYSLVVGAQPVILSIPYPLVVSYE